MKFSQKSTFLFQIFVAFLFIPSAQGQISGHALNKNVVIIYSDDHTYQALGAMGNKIISTPNLDKLAASGLLFTQAHVMGGHQGAICVPSRAMLMTGRYVNRLPTDGSVIPDSLISLPETLRENGYETYHTGKWHSDKASHHRMFSDGGDIYFGGMHFEKDGGQHEGQLPEALRGVRQPELRGHGGAELFGSNGAAAGARHQERGAGVEVLQELWHGPAD